VASQVAIKMLGTNGGGFFNANAAHPFENPTALSNFIQMLSIFVIGAAMTNVFGRMVGNQRQGWPFWRRWAFCSLLVLSSATGQKPTGRRCFIRSV
jgi:K+-transporting ATPase A subunit